MCIVRICCIVIVILYFLQNEDYNQEYASKLSR